MKFFFVIAATLLLFIEGTMAQTTNTFSDAELQGRSLAQQLCDGQPAEDFSQTAALKIKRAKAGEISLPIRYKGIVSPMNWSAVYTLNQLTNESSLAITTNVTVLEVSHFHNQPSKYVIHDGTGMSRELKADEAYIPFGGSDFWIADLGLEFFHWPAQKILAKPTNLKRGREYTLLESTNPNPSPKGYSRVVTWIDKETGGILEAEAYDVSGKLLKEFSPKSFKKVNGQWQLQEMDIRNVQTGSRTRLEFDLIK